MVASLKEYLFLLFWCFLFYFYEYLTLKKITVFLNKHLSFWFPWSHCYGAWESEATIHWGGNAKFAGNTHCRCRRQVPLSGIFTFMYTNKNSIVSTLALIPSSEPHHHSQQNRVDKNRKRPCTTEEKQSGNSEWATVATVTCVVISWTASLTTPTTLHQLFSHN